MSNFSKIMEDRATTQKSVAFPRAGTKLWELNFKTKKNKKTMPIKTALKTTTYGGVSVFKTHARKTRARARARGLTGRGGLPWGTPRGRDGSSAPWSHPVFPRGPTDPTATERPVFVGTHTPRAKRAPECVWLWDCSQGGG